MSTDDLLTLLSGAPAGGAVLTGVPPRVLAAAELARLVCRVGGIHHPPRYRLTHAGKQRLGDLAAAPLATIKGVPMRPTMTTQHRG